MKIMLPPENLPRQSASVVPTLQRWHAIDQNSINASGKLVRVIIGRALGDCFGIEDRNISPETFFKNTAILQAKCLSRRPGHLVNRVL
jgi:hypothetical protein